MDQNRICSLCILEKTSKDVPMLTRIADVQGDELVRFVYDESRGYVGDNANKVYYRRPPFGAEPEGTIGFWDWWPLDGDPTKQSSEQRNLRWIEHKRFPNVSGLGALKAMLLDDLGELRLDHDYLFEYESDGQSSRCLYCPAVSLIQTAGVTRLNKDVFCLSSYTIPNSDIGDPSKRGYKFRYYTRIEIGEPEGKILICAPVKIVSEQLKSRLKQYAQGKRSENAIIRSFLAVIPTTTLEQDIAALCDVDEKTAKSFIDAFVQRCENYLGGNDIEDAVLERVIENSAPVTERFRAAVEQDWLQRHADRIQQANAELDHVRQQVRDASDALAQRQQQTDALSAKSVDLALKISTAEQALDQARQRLEAARENAASLLTDYLLLPQPQSAHMEKEQPSTTVVLGAAIDADPETLEDVEDALSFLSRNLMICAGVARTQAKALATYMLSAFMSNTPLIIAGFGAQDLIDALSATLFNRTADRLYCDAQGACPAVSEDVGGVVAVYGGLQGQLSAFLCANDSPERYYCFVVPTSEEMSIEPAGLYDYALPLFTQTLITKPPKRNWYGSRCDLPKNPDPEPQRRCAIPAHIVSNLCRYRCAMLLDRCAEMGADISPYDELSLQTIPLMIALGRIDELIAQLETTDLSRDQLSEIKALCGVSDE